MISRRNYIAITVVMAITFFLFQFTNVMLESWNDYNENPYVRSTEELPGKNDVYVSVSKENTDGTRDRIVYIGDAERAVSEVVQTWTAYTKKELLNYNTFEEYEASGWKEDKVRPKMIVLDAKSIDGEKECEYLEGYVAAGMRLVFCNLPRVDIIRQNPKLQRLLGITGIKEEETKVEGLHLQEGFLLGGEVTYLTKDEKENERRQDMELSFPWYELSWGTEVYMRGAYLNQLGEDAPPVIWRNTVDGTDVFAVNGEYMEDVSGLGILSAVSAKINQYDIYPVVNAQNLVTVNFPGLSDENEEEMQNRYGQGAVSLLRDTVWPSIIAVYRQNALGLTCMIAPQYDYEDSRMPDEEQGIYFIKRLNEERAEAGISSRCVSGTSVRQKLKEDQRFMEEMLPEFHFSSFYAAELESEEIDGLLEDILKDVRTVVTDYDQGSEVIGYQTDSVTRQSILTDGVRHTYREDFRNRSVETALGYTSVLVDIGKIVYPTQEEDALTELTSYLNWNLHSYFNGFRGFEGTTVSECDEHIRNFLALDYRQHRENNAVYLELETDADASWFILRTRNETVSSMKGGSWQQLEKDVYLIEARNKNTVITLKMGH